MFRKNLIPAYVLATAFLPCAAQAADEDANIWLAQTTNIDLGNGAILTLEAQERFTNDASRLGQLLLRPAIGYKVNKTTTMSLGYAYVMTDPIGPAKSHEHRIFQQLSFRLLGDGKGATLTGRTRFEQRFFENQNGTGLRLRQQLRLTVPLAGKVRAVAWTEPFIGLNETKFQRDGVGLWSNSAGVTVPVGKKFTLEPGYINQYVVRNGRDRIDHTGNLTLSATF